MTQSTTERTNGRTGIAPLSESEWHRILSVERRRFLLDVLDDRPTPVGFDELAESVAAREAGTARIDVERVAITLHHNHLPRLAKLGVVEYDHEARLVESVRDDLSG